MILYKNIKIRNSMFTDHNQQFLKNFQQQEKHAQQLQCPTPNSAPVYRGNIIYMKDAKQNIEHQQIIPLKNKDKRLDFLRKTEGNNKIRNYSQEHIQKKVPRQSHQMELLAKSQASLSEGQLANGHDQDVQKSGKSIAAKTYKFDICELEGAFMKKIRNLQVRIKNMSLNYQTLLVKYKTQHSAADKQNNLIKQFLKQHHPNILQQVEAHIASISQSSKSSFGDSSSNKNNQQWMPIMSKIQQLKFDGQKMSQAIKNYQQNLLKKYQVQEQVNKHNSQQKIKQQKRKTILRKYSIPINFQRIKKQSFQTTMITQKKQGQTKLLHGIEKQKLVE